MYKVTITIRHEDSKSTFVENVLRVGWCGTFIFSPLKPLDDLYFNIN